MTHGKRVRTQSLSERSVQSNTYQSDALQHHPAYRNKTRNQNCNNKPDSHAVTCKAVTELQRQEKVTLRPQDKVRSPDSGFKLQLCKRFQILAEQEGKTDAHNDSVAEVTQLPLVADSCCTVTQTPQLLSAESYQAISMNRKPEVMGSNHEN